MRNNNSISIEERELLTNYIYEFDWYVPGVNSTCRTIFCFVLKLSADATASHTTPPHSFLHVSATLSRWNSPASSMCLGWSWGWLSEAELRLSWGWDWPKGTIRTIIDNRWARRMKQNHATMKINNLSILNNIINHISFHTWCELGCGRKMPLCISRGESCLNGILFITSFTLVSVFIFWRN